MSNKKIIAAYEEWRRAGRRLVLATVYETEGSTYSKTGHRILIADNGDYQGLISGGCLEGDLAEHAKRVIESGQAENITYDMRDEADEVWGLGIGCNGLIRVLLQRLTPDEGYEPFKTLARHILATDEVVCATVIESDTTVLPRGATFIDAGKRVQYWSVPDEFRSLFRDRCARVTQADGAGLHRLDVAAGRITVLYTVVRPLPRILVLGAGLDAQPLVEIAARIGWLVTIADHRPAYLQRDGLMDAQTSVYLKPEKLSETLNLSQFSAVIVMSHHLKSDRSYLKQLAASDIGYIGVLGPHSRRERLLSDLGTHGDLLRTRLRGPVGLDIGADSPESIALSILAEVHGVLAGRIAHHSDIEFHAGK